MPSLPHPVVGKHHVTSINRRQSNAGVVTSHGDIVQSEPQAVDATSSGFKIPVEPNALVTPSGERPAAIPYRRKIHEGIKPRRADIEQNVVICMQGMASPSHCVETATMTISLSKPARINRMAEHGFSSVLAIIVQRQTDSALGSAEYQFSCMHAKSTHWSPTASVHAR